MMMLRALLILVLAVCAALGQATTLGRVDLPFIAQTRPDPNADLNIGVMAAFLLDDNPVGNSYPNFITDTVHGYLAQSCNTAAITASGFGNIAIVCDVHANVAGDPSSARGFCGNQSGGGAGNPVITLSANQVFCATTWIKCSNNTGSAPTFDDWGTSGFYLGQSGGNKWTFGLHKGDNSTAFVDDASTDTGTFHLLAGGWDGANIWISVDGAAKTIGTAVANTHAFSDDIAISKYAGGCGTSIPTDGFIGPSILYTNVTLTDAQLSRIFNSRNGIAPVHGGPY